MDATGSSPPCGGNAVMKRRHSETVRRPRPDAQLALESGDTSSPSSTPSLSSSRRFFPDDSEGSDASLRKKEVHLNNLTRRNSSVGTSSSRRLRKDDKKSEELDDYYCTNSSRGGHGPEFKRCSEVVLALGKLKHFDNIKEGNDMQSNYLDDNKSKGSDKHSMHQSEGAPRVKTENKPRKVKFKIGGVTRMVHANSDIEIGGGEKAAAKPPRPLDASHHHPKLVTQVLSCKRISKKQIFDDDEKDNEVCYLEKLKTSEVVTDHMGEVGENDEDAIKKQKLPKLSRNNNTAYEMDEDFVLQSCRENTKEFRSGNETEDMDYTEDDEPVSDGTPEAKKKKQKTSMDSTAEIMTKPLTTRLRALQSRKGGNDASFIEFPDGLPSQPSRKSEETLTDVEKAAKKAEAAQRRKLQVEKRARESEASAIRKILGHDSDRKKAEKKQKELEEKAKAAESRILQPSTVRWVQGPNGTNLTFSDDIGIPTILNSGPCSYPPPREKCVGPSCTNTYRYRHSKSKLPLCSLQCYKAVQARAEQLAI